MEAQGGKDRAAQKKRTKRGRWTTAQRQEIVAASYAAGASINEVAEGKEKCLRNRDSSGLIAPRRHRGMT